MVKLIKQAFVYFRRLQTLWYHRRYADAYALVFITLLLQLTYSYLTGTTSLSKLALSPASALTTNAQCELLQAGRNSYRAKDFAAAQTAWKLAQHQYQLSKDKLCTAMVLTNLALAYQQQGKLPEAVTENQQSLQIILGVPYPNNSTSQLKTLVHNLTQISSNNSSSLAQLKVLAQALNTQGKLDFLFGKNDQAVEVWQLANNIYLQVNDSPGALLSQINLAQAMQAQGRYRVAKQTLQDASLLLLQTKGIKLDFKDLNQTQADKKLIENINNLSKSPLKTALITTFGNIYLALGEYEKAEQILVQVPKIDKESKQNPEILISLGNLNRALAVKHRNLGKLHTALSQAQLAINYYQESRKATKFDEANIIAIKASLNELSTLIDTQTWLKDNQYALSNDATLLTEYQGLNKSLKATITEKKLLELEKQVNNLPLNLQAIYIHINYVQNLINLIKLEIKDDFIERFIINQFNKIQHNAIDLYRISARDSQCWLENASNKGEDCPKILAYKRVSSYIFGTIGNLYETRSNLYNLKQDLQQAEYYTNQAIFSADQSKQSQDIIYKWQWQMGRILTTQGRTKEAITRYKEAVKTLDLLRGNLLGLNSEVQFSFRDNLEPIYRELVSLLLPVDKSQTNQEQLQEAIKQIDNLQLAELQNFLRCDLSYFEKSNSKKASNQNNNDILGLKLIELAKHNTALIYPIILKNRVVIIYKLPDRPLEYYYTIKNQTEVENTVKELQKSLERQGKTHDVKEQSSKVYKWIIAPIKNDLENHQNIETLLFVLDGALRNIPMAVLYDNDQEEYLLQNKYAIAVAPILGIVDSQSIQKKQKILAAALTETQEGEGLLYAEKEIESIDSKTFVKPLKGKSFTKKNLQKEINSGEFSIVHLATHGQFSSNPEKTYIVTYEAHITGEELNNLVSPSSLNRQNLSSRIDLLTLSACETAKGDNRATLGLAGISIRAGARSTLSTLWKADDKLTAELMAQFYQELSSSKITKAKALHHAQLFMFNEIDSRPYIWANYVLVGNWL